MREHVYVYIVRERVYVCVVVGVRESAYVRAKENGG